MHSVSLHTPLLISPQGGKEFTPSPLGEVPIAIGREGGWIELKSTRKDRFKSILKNLLHEF